MTMPASYPELFDIVVLGSGEGGKYIAWTMAKKGKRVVVIERKWVGGSCPNVACLPGKNIIHSAKIASYFFRSGEFGISKENTRIDMPVVRDRKRKMVAGLVDSDERTKASEDANFRSLCRNPGGPRTEARTPSIIGGRLN
jgi:pyruvate/2-oxoglutarate dehydrogenase complex dihydrolipoamide dehydrogenase (E3) component